MYEDGQMATRPVKAINDIGKRVDNACLNLTVDVVHASTRRDFSRIDEQTTLFISVDRDEAHLAASGA